MESTSTNFDAFGTAMLLLSQMSFACFGTFANNLLLVTLKDLPDLSASTYHILLTNLGLSNLFTCTVLKPATGIYIGRQKKIMLSALNIFVLLDDYII